MRIAVTGGTGLVGRFIVRAALAGGHAVTVLGRSAPAPGAFAVPVRHRPFALGEAPDLSGADALVHAAFDHVPGRYRGGEGDDPAGFRARNVGGTEAVFEAALAAGVERVVFLSSRAVYDGLPVGTTLREDAALAPDTLYGQAKLAGEAALAARAPRLRVAASLRATGVYGPAGPGQAHKWAGLFADFHAGRPIAPRRATEVHGDDLAAAVLLLLEAGEGAALQGAWNVSDIVLDRRELLAEVAALTGCAAPLPPADPHWPAEMPTGRLRALGWKPSGLAGLRAALPEMLDA